MYLRLNFGDVGVAPRIVGSRLNIPISIQVPRQERLSTIKKPNYLLAYCMTKKKKIAIEKYTLCWPLDLDVRLQTRGERQVERYLLADKGGAKIVGGRRSSGAHSEGVGDLEVGCQDLSDVASCPVKYMVRQERVYSPYERKIKKWMSV